MVGIQELKNNFRKYDQDFCYNMLVRSSESESHETDFELLPKRLLKEKIYIFFL